MGLEKCHKSKTVHSQTHGFLNVFLEVFRYTRPTKNHPTMVLLVCLLLFVHPFCLSNEEGMVYESELFFGAKQRKPK